MAFSFFNENGRIVVEIMDDFSPPLSSSSSFTEDDSNHSESESIDIVEDRLIEITINDEDDDDQKKEIMYIEIDEPDYKQFNTFRMQYRLFLLVEMGRDLDVPTDVYHYIISVCSLLLLCLYLCISQFYSVCLYVVIVKLFCRIIRLVIVQSVRYSMVIKISCVSSAVTDESMTVITACIVRIIKLSYV